MKQLERLLFLQGNRCFFCGESIPNGEASVEHLVASSRGGTKDDDNCVVCCKSVNMVFGNLSLKAKLQAVLSHRGEFTCPRSRTQCHPVPATASVPPLPSEQVAAIVKDLQKRGAHKPRRVVTLKNTMNSLFKGSLQEEELDALLAILTSEGYVTIVDTKVSYALPADD